MAKPKRQFSQDRAGQQEMVEKVVQINRVSKKTKGGNRMSFSVLVVVGDRRGRVGVAVGKAPDVISGIKKGIRRARLNMITVPMKGTTLPFSLTVKDGAARVMLKPAPTGTGVIAGGAVRAVLDAAGVRDVVSKILGTNNKASNVYATFTALRRMSAISAVKQGNAQLKTGTQPGQKNLTEAQ